MSNYVYTNPCKQLEFFFLSFSFSHTLRERERERVIYLIMYIRYQQFLLLLLLFAGELAPNNAILRDISSLCNQLPVLDNQLFEKSFQDVSKHAPKY